MRMRAVCVFALFGILLLPTGFSQEPTSAIELGSEAIYLGERFLVTVNVSDTLIVLNLNNPTKVYEFKFDQPGTMELCFVRPCDHPCECVPVERLIPANPGDEILFVLKGNPQKEELRRVVQRCREASPSIQLDFSETAGKCVFKVTLTNSCLDLACDLDKASAYFYVNDPEKALEIVLAETGPATGVFVGELPIEIRYSRGKFTVCYGNKMVDVVLPDLPQACVKVGDKEQCFALVSPIEEAVLTVIPPKFRMDCCSFPTLEVIRGLIQSELGQNVDVSMELAKEEGKLYVIAKKGCQYFAGTKEVTILPPVQLVVKDEKGNVLHGGRLEAGKKYVIEAQSGQEDGCILIVELGPSPDKCGQLVESAKGPYYEWTPKQGEKTFAIIYVDKYFCNPPALIVTVD